MAVMSYFCFFFPLRLGVIICSVLVMIQTIIPLVYILIYDADDIRRMSEETQEDIEDFDTNFVFDWLLEYFKNNSGLVWIGTLIFNILLFIFCILNILGALKKIKYLLLPFIIFEFLRLLSLLGTHVLYMMIFKSQIDLGYHIILTCAGGFLILYLAYSWSTAIALFQILTEINKEFKLKVEPIKEVQPKGITSIYTYSNPQETLADQGIFAKEFSAYDRKRNFVN